MDCNDIKALLSGLMDGQLDPPRQHEAERHLASCADCRRLIDRAEQVEFSLNRTMQARAGDPLPTGFVEFVLGQTSRSPSLRPGRWTNYFGWVAAAASLVLAMTIWVMDRRSFIRQDAAHQLGGSGSTNPTTSHSVVPTVYTPGRELQSFVLDVNAAGLPQSFVGEQPSDRDATPVVEAVAVSHAHSLLSRSDGDALMTASMLLDHLSRSSERSFASAERIRQAAEYEQIVPQLRDLRDRVAASDRAIVYAAETVLQKLADGPLSMQDLAQLRQTVAALRLSEAMHDLGAAELTANSI
jgi:hypothetical protein